MFYTTLQAILSKIKRMITCKYCLNIILFKNSNYGCGDHTYSSSNNKNAGFIQCISNSGLIHPPDIIDKIVEFAERQFRLLNRQNMTMGVTDVIRKGAVQYFFAFMDSFVPEHPVTEEFISEDRGRSYG